MRSSLAGVAAVLVLLLSAGAAGAQAGTAAGEPELEGTAPKPVDLLGSGGHGESRAAQDGEKEPLFDDPEEQRRWEQSFGPGGGPGETQEGSPDSGSSLGRRMAQTVTALFIVLALILLCYWAMRRFGGRTALLAGSSLGSVLGQIHLSSKVSLHFVRVKDRVVVVGATSNAIAPVAEFDAALFREEPARLAPLVQEKGAQFLAQLRDSTQRLHSGRDDGDVSAAADPHETEAASEEPEPAKRGRPERVQGKPPAAAGGQAGDEIAELREGIRRLQAELQEASRELEQ